MRLDRLVLLLLAACGSSSNTPDASVNNHPDAPNSDATVHDDAPNPDAPSGPMSRVWVVGDFLTDGKVNAGAFVDSATLPFNPMTPPPVVLPAGTSVLGSGAGYTTNVIDATPDGSKIAFVADLATAGTFDLYVAGGDGSSPTLLVTGQANIEIQAVSISPDGTKVAYLSDSAAINGGYDLYFVATTAGATPAKVSPDRPMTSPAPANQDVFFQVTWSADSKYLAFSADLTQDTFDQAYCVDTTAATPAAVELLAQADIGPNTGAQGVRGGLQFDAMNNVYFRARIVTGSTQFQLFQAKPDGSMRTLLPLPARTDTTASDAGAFQISPDGMAIAFSADAPTATQYNVFYAPIASIANPMNLTNLTAAGHTDFTTPLWFSPDGKQVAFVGNFLSARSEPFVAATDGTNLHRLVNVLGTCSGCTSPDANLLQWSVNGAYVFVQGDMTANNDTKIYRVDPKMTDQTPALAVDVPTAGDMTNLLIRRM